MKQKLSGSCLCGATQVKGTLLQTDIAACHCTQCRAMTGGGPWLSANLERDDAVISGPVRWFASSATAQRGFCGTCGGFLFWKMDGDAHISVSAGLFPDAGLQLSRHIFAGGRGEIYEITDDLPQYGRGSSGPRLS